ncbi:MAG TPA: sugar phosphate isomerase/epimerase [Planctomycetota bacterium]|nr:sugar phosphate isomerase/epimerase [Planctomycetota bacterium]
MEPRLSMWTSFFIDLSPEEALGELAAAGWRHAELSDEHSKALLERGDPAAAGQAFRRVAADAGVSIPQGHLWLTVDIAPASEAARREAMDGLRRWLDLYVAIGIRAAVIHPGGNAHHDPAARCDEQLHSLADLAGHVRGTGLVLCLENCSSGEALKPLLAATSPAEVGVCLDTGHLNLTPESQGGFIRFCAGRLRALHLAENDRSGDQHNFPYARGGCVPWDEVAAALAEVRYDGLLNFEVPGENRCPIPARRIKLAYLRALATWIFAPRHA